MSKTAIEFKNVKKHFNHVEALEDVSFSVEEGSIFGYLGPNGSGKTTTVRLANGLIKNDDGEIKIFGEKISTQKSDFRIDIGVQTDTNLYDQLTAVENLELWGKLYEMDSNTIKKQVSELLGVFHLDDRKLEKVGTYSKGMKQKLSIARALIHSPKILFLDEPTAGLDPEAASELLQLLKEYVGKYDATVFLCSHRLEEVEKLCDSIGIIYYGKLKEIGNVKDLIKSNWQDFEFEILSKLLPSSDVNKIIQGKLIKSIKTENDGLTNIKIAVSDINQIPQLIKQLVDQNIQIFEVKEIKHSLSDLYFKFTDQNNDK